MSDLLWIFKEISPPRFSQKTKWRCLVSTDFQLYCMASKMRHLFFITHSPSLSNLQIRMENRRSSCNRKHFRCVHTLLLYVYRPKNPYFWRGTWELRTLNFHWKNTFLFILYYPFFLVAPLSFLILKLFHAIFSN